MRTTTTRPIQAPAQGLVLATLLTAIAPVSWGTTYLVTTEFLPPGHPMFAALVRALPAGLLAIALTRTLPRGRWWGRALVLGTLNIGAFQPLLFATAERLPGGVAATLGAVQPLVVAGLAVLVLGERPSWRRIGWGLAGVLGVALVVLGPAARLDAVGLGTGLLGASVMALGLVLTKKWGRPDGVGHLAYAGWQLAAGGLVLLPLTFAWEGVPPAIGPAAVLAYAWLGLVGGLVAYALWFRGVQVLPVTATALLGLLSPLTAAALGVLVAGEAVTAMQAVGFVVALVALVAGQRTAARSPSIEVKHP